MLELALGSILTLVSLLIGFSLGKHNQIIPNDTKKQIKDIFRRIVPDDEIGAIPVLTQRELDVARDPRLREEQSELDRTLDKLNQ